MKKTNQLYLIICLIISPYWNYATDVNNEWTKSLTAKNNTTASKVAVDSYGYIYVAGTFNSSSQGKNWKLVKLKPNKDTLFTITFNGSNNGDDFVNAITIDKDNYIYLTGSFATGSGTSKITTSKVSNTGSVIWQVYQTPITGLNEGKCIAVDDSGKVYVAANLTDGEIDDAIIIKFNSDGSKAWHYDINSEEEQEYIKGIAVCPNYKLAVIYDFYAGIWNFITLCLGTQGTAVYETTFGGRGSTAKQCNDLTVDASNNVYVTGYSVDHHETKDFVTVKYNTQGHQQWYALLDETDREDEAIAIKVFGDYLIVTGNSVDSAKGDIVTIGYSLSGVQGWKQRFNGQTQGDDFVTGIVKNGATHFVVAGNVTRTSTTYEPILLNYNFSGQLQWSNIYRDSSLVNNVATDIAVDFLGNFYLPYNCTDTSGTAGNVLKVNQPPITLPILKEYLKKLTVGLLDISSDTIVKSIFYESCSQTVDSFYYISYHDLITQCGLRSLDLKGEMNDKIADFYSLPAYNYVDYIFEHFWLMGYRQSPLLAIPHYHHFNSSQLQDDPKLAYALDDDNYPISCINCSGATINKAGTETYRTWISMITAPWWYYQNGNTLKYITNCVGRFTDAIADPSLRCGICPANNTVGQLGVGSGNAGNNELEITLDYNGNPGNDGCYSPIVPFLYSYYQTAIPTGYARLTRLFDLPVYSKITLATGGERRIKKEQYGIHDRLYKSPWTGNYSVSQFNQASWERGDILSICENNIEFNIFGEMLFRFATGFGFYKLDRPGLIQQKPIYFMFPFAEGIWYIQGPDMGINYGIDDNGTCNNGYKNVLENNETSQCIYCGYAPLAISGISSTDVRKYLATTDYSFISGYWMDNVISVGFRPHSNSLTSASSGIPGLNLYDFSASSSPTPCTPPLTTPLAVLELLSTGEYVVTKDFANGVGYLDGTHLLIHVEANFKNGESINECMPITLANPASLTQTLRNITVNIRGDIKDYSSSVTNYKVTIYP